MTQTELNGRKLDPRTMTYSYSDGSGLITPEQVFERKLLKSKIEELETSNGNLYLLAMFRFKYLTYFSKL